MKSTTKGIMMNDDNGPTRRFVEQCYRTSSTMINPIVDWTDEDVWAFLRHYGCEGNPLYQCRRSRIGCIGCPMQGGKGMKADFNRYPKYQRLYLLAFDKMLKEARLKGKSTKWKSAEEVMAWWVEDDPDQICLGEEDFLMPF